MTSDARRIVDDAITLVAPDLDPSTFTANDQLRAMARLDSFDFLHVLAAIDQACGVEVPEADYERVGTYGALVDYVSQAIASRS